MDDNKELREQSSFEPQNIAEEKPTEQVDMAEEKKKDAFALYNIRPQDNAEEGVQEEQSAEERENFIKVKSDFEVKSEEEPVGPPIYAPQPVKTVKKKNPWKIVAIVLIAIMFGCAFATAVIIPTLELINGKSDNALEEMIPSIYGDEDKEEKQEETPQPTKKQQSNFERDYSGVNYPKTLPDFDGKSITITNKYNPLPEIFEQTTDAVVSVVASTTDEEGNVTGSRGSGVIISTEGYIITNNHVVASGKDIQVYLNDGRRCKGVVMGCDSSLDVAVIKVEEKGLKAIKIGRSADLKVGEMALAIGTPSGAGTILNNTLTAGYISGVDRDLMFNDTRRKFIQTDAAINPGNSGGALLNDRGEIVGIVTLKSLVSTVDEFGESINAEGMGFAIPIDTAMKSIDSIILEGDVKRPGLGVKVYEIGKELSDQEKIPEGIRIESFIDGSSAEAAGLEIGDIIIEADGIETKTLEEFQSIINGKIIGEEVNVKVYRDGKEKEINVKLSDLNKID